MKFKNTSDAFPAIVSFRKIHDDLNEAVELINQAYSVQIMFYFVFSGSIFLIFIFSLITFQSYFNINQHLLLLIGGCVWNFFQIAFVLIVMGVGSAATKEGQRTSSIVHKILNKSLHQEIDLKVIFQLFIVQTIKKLIN